MKVYIDDILYVAESNDECINFSKKHSISYKEVGKLSVNINEDVNMVVFLQEGIINENIIKK